MPTNDETVEERLRVLEKPESRMFEILKWGMGIFGVFAVAFAGFNWWSAKTNYERDRDYLKQQTDILARALTLAQHELMLSNDQRIDTIRKDTQNSLLSISNSLQEEFTSLLRTNELRYSNSLVNLTNAIVQLTLGITNVLSQYGSNILSLVSSQETNINIFLTNAATHLTAQITQIDTNSAKYLYQGSGMAFMLQGNMIMSDVKKRTGRETKVEISQQFQEAAESHVEAAHLLLAANEEQNLSHCLAALCDSSIPGLINNTSKEGIAHVMESKPSFVVGLTNLIFELEKSNPNGGYTDRM
jgi:hypothetical protein